MEPCLQGVQRFVFRPFGASRPAFFSVSRLLFPPVFFQINYCIGAVGWSNLSKVAG
jgi:hypothetical protein